MALRNQLNSTIVKRYIEILEERLQELTKKGPSDFDNPNWELKEAFRQGREFEILNSIRLFDFNK